jgi:predicted metal-dependent phosphoesterase TrpH
VQRIDLHTHSTASDGTDTPSELVVAAAQAGLDVVAITDHDSTAGWSDAVAAGERVGVRVVPGVEISTARDGRSLHLLAYHLDPADLWLLAETEHTRSSRQTRLQRIVDRLAAGGIPVTLAEVTAQVPPGATAGRPHIADALVAGGVVRDRDEAFRRFLHGGSRYVVSHYAPDPADAVRAVRAAGGVPVLAHPFGSTPYAGSDAMVEELAAAGLFGLETAHRDHDDAARRRGRALAVTLGLLETGASDYHGTGKQNRLGEHLTDPDTLAAIDAAATDARTTS